MTYTIDKVLKHSVRYKATNEDKSKGPVTVYIPNEMFQNQPGGMPRSLELTVKFK